MTVFIYYCYLTLSLFSYLNKNEISSYYNNYDSKENVSLNQCRNKYFQLISAKSQEWTSGLEEGGSGNEYYFIVRIKTNKAILFKNAWINNKKYDLYAVKNNSTITDKPIEINYNDTITLRVSTFYDSNTPRVKSSLKLKENALISYTINEKLKFYNIKSITKENQIYHQ